MASKKLRTYADVADWQGVSVRAVEGWRRRADWPGREPDGSFSRRKLTAFLKANKLGKYREQASGSSDEYRAALTIKAREQAENERIKKERALVEQAIELGDIVLASDVLALEARRAATVMTIHDALHDVVDRVFSEKLPADQATYAAIRERILTQIGKLNHDVYEAMKGASDADESKA